MNIKRAKQEIKDTIEAYLKTDQYGDYVIPRMRQRPVLLIGAPGIGKTQIMEQIAKECELSLVAYTITHHTRQSAIGLPFISKEIFGGKEYAVTEYTMSEIVASLYQKMEKTGRKEGILFIDEINCVSETLAPAMLQFLQYKSFGNHEIPEGWIIVAAGNPPEYNRSVREFDVVTMDRVKKIDVEPDYTAWKEYALTVGLHPAVISYLDLRTENFYRMETTVDGKTFATPRGWEDLSEVLSVYESMEKTVDWEVVISYIQHEKTAKDFANYLELYHNYELDYQLDAILEEGRIGEIVLKKAAHAPFDERLGVVSLLLAGCRSRFTDVISAQEELDLLYRQLVKFRDVIEQPERRGTDPALLLDGVTRDLETEYDGKEKGELLTRRVTHRYIHVIGRLEDWTRRLRTDKPEDPAAGFAQVKIWFDALQDELEANEDRAADALEHAFDFMEAAFGGGQEMVLFITELNSDPFAVRFLEQVPCERYYQYNQNLLFSDRTAELERRLARFDG